MVDVVARAALYASPDLVVYVDSRELDIVARYSHDQVPDLNVYPPWNFLPPAATGESTPVIITMTFGHSTEVGTAYSLVKIKKTQFDRGSDTATAYSLVKTKRKIIGSSSEVGTTYTLTFSIIPGGAATIKRRRYLLDGQLLRHPRNSYPLGTLK